MKKVFGGKKDIKVKENFFFGCVAVSQIDVFFMLKSNSKALVIMFDCIPDRAGTKGNIHSGKVERHKI